ncbi:MAG: chemotaxis protein CheW [Gammaproteobacteria bacterium]|nr:chemotaxis protein CheW [Gammaproteobacteria bacterium]
MKAIDAHEQLLIFRVGPIACCVAARDVDSIVNAKALHKLPRQADFIAGILQYRESTASIVNLYHKFSLVTPESVMHGRFIMAYTRHGITGFWVDEIVEITNDFDQNWSAPPSFVEDNVFDRTLVWNDKLILETNFDRLFSMKNSGALSEWASSNDQNWEIRKQGRDKEKTKQNNKQQHHINENSEYIINDLVTRGTVLSKAVVSVASVFDEQNSEIAEFKNSMPDLSGSVDQEEHLIGLEEVFSQDEGYETPNSDVPDLEVEEKIESEVVSENDLNAEVESGVEPGVEPGVESRFELDTSVIDEMAISDSDITAQSQAPQIFTQALSENINKSELLSEEDQFKLTLQGNDFLSTINDFTDDESEVDLNAEFNNEDQINLMLPAVDEDSQVMGFDTGVVTDFNIESKVDSGIDSDRGIKTGFDADLGEEFDSKLESEVVIESKLAPQAEAKSISPTLPLLMFEDETVSLEFIREENDTLCIDDVLLPRDPLLVENSLLAEDSDLTTENDDVRSLVEDDEKTIVFDSGAEAFEDDVAGFFTANLNEQVSIYQTSIESQIAEKEKTLGLYKESSIISDDMTTEGTIFELDTNLISDNIESSFEAELEAKTAPVVSSVETKISSFGMDVDLVKQEIEIDPGLVTLSDLANVTSSIEEPFLKSVSINTSCSDIPVEKINEEDDLVNAESVIESGNNEDKKNVNFIPESHFSQDTKEQSTIEKDKIIHKENGVDKEGDIDNEEEINPEGTINKKGEVKKEEAIRKILGRIENNSPDKNRTSSYRVVASILVAATGVFLAEHYGVLPDSFNTTKMKELVLLTETTPSDIADSEQLNFPIETVAEKYGESISVAHQQVVATFDSFTPIEKIEVELISVENKPEIDPNIAPEVALDAIPKAAPLVEITEEVSTESLVKQHAVNKGTVNDAMLSPKFTPPVYGTHDIVRGDTLWTIAGTYLNNPFRYPDLARWSKIKNPDLIYPGNVVKYVPPADSPKKP